MLSSAQVKHPFVAQGCTTPGCTGLIKKILCAKCSGTANGVYYFVGDVDIIDWNDADYRVKVGNITNGGESLFGTTAPALCEQNYAEACERIANSKQLMPYKVTVGVRWDNFKQDVTVTAFNWTKLSGPFVDASPALRSLLGPVFD